jgi:hypothetical protein
MDTKIARYQRILYENKNYSDSNSVFFMSSVKGGIHPASYPWKQWLRGTDDHSPPFRKKKVKISLLQAVEAPRVARGRGSHIT